MKSLTDADLIEGSRAGDRSAFAELVERHRVLVTSFAVSRVGSVLEAEELAQETFVVAWQNLSQLRQPAQLRSWLCGIVKNLHRRYSRDQRRQAMSRSPEDDAHVASAAPSPLDQVISFEERRLLSRALTALPEGHREVLFRFYGEQQGADDIAQALGLTVKTVHDRLFTARRMLKTEVAAVESALNRWSARPALAVAVLAAISAAGARGASAAPAGKVLTGKTVTLGLGGLAAVSATIVALNLPSSGEARPTADTPPLAEATSLAAPVAVPAGLRPQGTPQPPVLVDDTAPAAKGSRSLYLFDFVDGERPSLLVQGLVVSSGPDRDGDRSSVLGTIDPRWPGRSRVRLEDPPAITRGKGWVSRPLFTTSQRTIIRFDYWASSGSGVALEVSNLSKRLNYGFNFPITTHGAWVHVEVPVLTMKPNLPGRPALEEGDVLTKIEIAGGDPERGPFYVDNIEVVD